MAIGFTPLGEVQIDLVFSGMYGDSNITGWPARFFCCKKFLVSVQMRNFFYPFVLCFDSLTLKKNVFTYWLYCLFQEFIVIEAFFKFSYNRISYFDQRNAVPYFLFISSHSDLLSLVITILVVLIIIQFLLFIFLSCECILLIEVACAFFLYIFDFLLFSQL